MKMIEDEIQDYLTESNVFLSGFKENEIASLGAYGTVISFNNLEKAINESNFTLSEWEKCIDFWDFNSYLGPSFRLLSLWSKRLVNKKFNIEQ